MLEAQLQVSDESELLFTTPTGRMWRERTSTATFGGPPKKPLA